jgi:glycosyltransferase involved in cell wall biosynthesis
MRILILTQWFNPEQNFKGLAFAKELHRFGHHVEVLTGFPNYPGGKLYPGYTMRVFQREDMDGIPVIRVPLYPSHDQSALKRCINYLSFALSAALLGPFLVRKADIMYVYHPPATIGLSAIVISIVRRIPFVYDVADLWPDTLKATGMIRSKIILRAVGLWCRFVYWKARRIVVISQGFKTRLLSLNIPPNKVTVIYNWCDEAQLKPGELTSADKSKLKGRFNIVFAGNMGKAQGLDIVLHAAQRLQTTLPQVQFVLVGSGIELPRIKSAVESRGINNIIILPARPVSQIGALLRAADALLVHLKTDPLFKITIPSKIQAYLAVGRPLLAGVDGEAADMVLKAHAGIVFKPEDVAGLVAATEALLALNTDDLNALGARGATYYKEHLAINVGTGFFASVFESARCQG